jgi:hypothetical protein
MCENHIRSEGEKSHNFYKDFQKLEEILLSWRFKMRFFSKSDDDQEIKTRAVRG